MKPKVHYHVHKSLQNCSHFIFWLSCKNGMNGASSEYVNLCMSLHRNVSSTELSTYRRESERWKEKKQLLLYHNR
jgi:hypothetical protein